MTRRIRKAHVIKVRQDAAPRPDGTARDVSALLSVAIEQHNAGNSGRADALYREALLREPGNADALHLLGVLAHEQGRGPEAIDLIGRALALAPTVPDYLFNLGNALRDQGRLEEAVASYGRALAASVSPGETEKSSTEIGPAPTGHDAGLAVK